MLLTTEQPNAATAEQTMGYHVLHIVDESLPLVSGYAIRTNGIAHGQLDGGNRPIVLTGPAHEVRQPDSSEMVIDRVRYLRTTLKGAFSARALRRRWPIARELAHVHRFRQRILEVIDSEPVDILHAHSPALCGVAAAQAAKSRGLPLVYEIRAFWEDAAVDQKKTSAQSLRYSVSRHLENYVVQRADAVVGIATSILDELRSRNVASDKLFHVPNGVNIAQFQPLQRDHELAGTLNLDSAPVLGFIGSLFYFEGIAWLVRAAVELHRRGAKFKLVIIGHGEDAENIKREIAKSNAADYILFLGKVPHDKVTRYYSVIDVLVYPRLSRRITELVTPLKPLEAMALERTVLGSSVGGIRELVTHGQTGLLFSPEDIDDFCAQANRLLQDCQLRDALRARGREMVVREKDWRVVAGSYNDIYRFATEHRKH